MTIKDLKGVLAAIPPDKDDTEVVGEACFGRHHGLALQHAGLGQEDKFVLFFKERKEA